MADRGFLHIKTGYTLNCPVGLNPKESQLSTADANESRLVTRFRHIVERFFGRFKMNWKVLLHVIDDSYIPKLDKLVKVLCAIENAYYDKLWTDFDTDETDITSLTQRNTDTNLLQDITTGWKGGYTLDYLRSITPVLSKEQLREYCIGPYALRLIKPYLDRNQELKLFKHKTKKDHYKITGITSRFVKTDAAQPKTYSVTLYLPNNNINEIVTYCTCKTGARTLGGCVHSTVVLYYLTVNKGDTEEPVKNIFQTAKHKTETVLDIRPFKLQKLKERGNQTQVDDSDDE